MYLKLRPVCWVVTLLSLLCVSCSPRFNWREVVNEAGAYRATFPDKPAQMKRVLKLINLEVPFTLQVAKVDDFYFAVGFVPLKGDLKGKGQALRAALAQGLANSFELEQAELRPLTWLGLPTHVMQLQGVTKQGMAAQAQARFIEQGDVLYQVTLVSPVRSADKQLAEQWFSGFAPLGRRNAHQSP